MSEAKALSPRKARARYRSWHRGIKEMDLILGQFADSELAGMSEEELDAYEALMGEQDLDLYKWISGEKPVPPEVDTEMFRRVVAFRTGMRF